MILTFFSADKYGIKSDVWKSFVDGFEFFQKELEKYKASLNGAKFSLSDFNTALQQSKAKSLESGEAVEGLTLKMVALRAGATLLNVALNAIVSTVANFVITKFNEWRTAIETNAQKSKELSSSMTDLISQYKELGDKSGWDTDDFAQAKDLNAEILDLLKNQSAAMDEKLRKLDLENGKYQEQIDLLNDLSISTLTQNKADQGKLLEQTAKGKSSGQYVIGDSSDTDMENALGGKFGGSLDNNTGVFNFGEFDPNDADSILAYYDKLSDALDYLGSNYDSATLEASSLYNQLKSEKNAIEDQANAYRNSSDTLKEVVAAQKLSSTSSKRSEEDIKAVTDALEGLKGAYGGITSGNLVSFLSGDKKLGGTYSDALNQLKEVMLNLGFDDNASDAQAFVDVLVQLGIVSSSSASKVDGLSESASAAADQLKEATDGLDKIQSAYSTLSDVVDEYNENGYLTVSTLTDLINLGPEYYDCLVDESGQLAINTENINTMADAYYEMAKAALYAQAIESMNANTNTYANASKFLSQAQQEVKDMKSLLYAEGQRLIDEGGLSGDALATQVQAQQRIINTYSAMMDLLDKTHAQSAENQFRNPKDKSSNKSSGSEDKMTDAVSAWKTLSAAMEEYNQYGNLCISTLNDLLGLEDDYTSLLTEQNGKMSINTTEFKNLMFAQIAQANATDESGKSAAELKRILQYVDENVKGDTISFEQLTDAIEGYGTAMDKAKQKTDAIKSAFSSLSEVSKNKIDSPFGVLDSDDVDKQYQAIRDLYDKTDLFTNPDFAGALNPETGTVDFNSEAFKQAFLSYLDEMIAACETTGGKAGAYLAQGFKDAKEKVAGNIISVEEYVNGLGSTLSSINDRMDNFQSAFNDLSDVVDEYNKYGDLSQDSIQKLMGLDVKYTACLDLQGDKLVFNKEAFRALYVAQLQKLAADYEGTEIGKRYAEILQKVADGTWDVTDHMKGMGTEVEKLKSGLSDLKDIFSSLLSLFEKFNTDKDNDLKLWGEAMTEDIDKRIEALNKQKEALEKANDEEERAITLAKLKAELEKARTQRTVRKLTSNGYEWVADESAVKEAKDNLSDQQREWRKEDAEKAIDDQIDKLNELKDKYSEAMNLIGTSLDDYNKKLRYAAQIQDMTFSEMEGRVDEYKNKIIASFTNVAPVSGIQNLISNIESLINTLTKLNNVYSWAKTGEYKDLGTTGLWNTIKGFFNKGKSENVNKSFKDTLNAAKKALNAGKKELTDTATTGASDVIHATINQIKTSSSGLIDTFGGIWEKIKAGAQSLFNGSGSGGGIVSTVVDGFKTIGNAVGKSKIGSTLIKGAGKLVAGASGLIETAGTALAAAGPYAIPIAAAAGLGIYSGVKGIKHQKEIWSNKDDGFGKKAIKSVASFFWDISPIGGIVNLCKDIFGKNKEIADNTKNNGKDNQSSGTTSSGEGIVIGNIKGKKAGGSRSIKQSGRYNVDERGPELLVRQPVSGRYTYLETGDGVVPADITSRLFDMGGNPERWFTEQMERNAGISNVQNRTVEGDKITIGDIYIQNPVGGVDDLAREINQRMPAMFKQIQSKR